jgi:predicted GNAT family acetyltransferase
VRPKTNHQATKEERNRMNVSHDEAKKRFSLRCNPTHPVVAVVDYEIISPGVWDLKFTHVAPEFQHHGVADEVILRTMEFVEANNIKVVPSCSYISETWFARHPEWKKLQAEEKKMQEGSKKSEQSLKYTDRVKKEENNAPDPQFTAKQGNSDKASEDSNEKSSQQSQEKQGQEMKPGSKSSAEKRSEKESQTQAASRARRNKARR